MVIFVFSPEKTIGINFRACLHAHKYSQKLDILACIHTKWASLFSRVVIFAGGNFRIFSRRENYNSAKINVLKVFGNAQFGWHTKPPSESTLVLKH